MHALQNHDELTYELVHFAGRHADEAFAFRGTEVTGMQLAEVIRRELTARLTGPEAPYNAIFTTNGIASTTATVVAASLGYRDLLALSADQIEMIKKAHLLLAKFNAWQPGVFALSGWDLCGMLTLDQSVVSDLVAEGDTRWIHRSAYDLMNYRLEAAGQDSSMPSARCLYGSLPAQLADPTSFASQLTQILTVRKQCRIATGSQVEIAETTSAGLLAMIHQLDGGRLQITLLNFSPRAGAADVTAQCLPPGAQVVDVNRLRPIGRVSPARSFRVGMQPYEGLCALVDV